jgi:N-acetylmuramoyl-L-alanine amidase
VLDLSEPIPYEIKAYSAPDRIAVNLPGAAAAKTIDTDDIADGVVSRVRVNRLEWGAQVVFDLRGAAGWSDHRLYSVDGMPDRIVIDVATAALKPTDAVPPPGDTAASVSAPLELAFPVKTDVKERRTLIIAVDAGHGGKDFGTKGKPNLYEKDLALDIARRLAAELERHEGLDAILTRDRDVFLDLIERTRIAKRKGSDIFVSVHLNSAPRKSARGIEVWFISPAGAEATAKRILSNRDNAARELGLESPENSDIMQMLVDVNQQAMMERSFLLAEQILNATDRSGLPPARSVKQQSFAVLKSIDMPSVLVEAGFLSNSQDAAFIKRPEGRQAVAQAVASGIVSYFRKYPPPPPAPSAGVVHKVRAGETLWAISKQYNTTVALIRESNGLAESDVLYVGQQLVIRESHDGR